jgi:hypothetical protein
MLEWLFGSKSDNKIIQLLAPGHVGYLSASCCNPAAGPVDEQLVTNLKQAMANLGLDLTIYKETLTGAQAGMRSAMMHLSLKQGKVVTKVMGLFNSKGMTAFPMLFVDGDVAFYGGVPSTAEIEEYLRPRRAQLTSRSAAAAAAPASKQG